VPLLEEALSLLGDEDSALRARVLARLGGALRDETSPDRRSALSVEAVAVARRVGDPGALVFALSGHLFAALASDDPNSRLAAADELLEIATGTGNLEGAFEAHDHRSSALMELGDIEAVDRTNVEMARLARNLRQPAQLWLLTTNRALRALLAGRFAEAEKLVYAALEIGTRAQPREARFTFRVQLAALRKAQGRLAEIGPEIERSLSEYPNRTVFLCLVVDLRSRLGREEEARDLLAGIDIEALPTSDEWLYAIHFLCEACASLKDVQRASVLYELLLPHAGSTASLWADGNAGSVARYLGLLSAATSRLDEAAAHYETALAANRRLGARPWLAHTQKRTARACFSRGVTPRTPRKPNVCSTTRSPPTPSSKWTPTPRRREPPRYRSASSRPGSGCCGSMVRESRGTSTRPRGGWMYAVVRSYRARAELADVLISHATDVERVISAIAGFKAYYLVRTAEGAVSFSVYEDEGGAEESNRAVADWIREHLPTIAGVAPDITGGKVVISA
jgi:tetratricopeptide (TPR) repeat protein